MMPGQINNAKQVLAFMFAGNATMTFRSAKTGDRRTYKIRLAEKQNPNDPETYFVKLLNGADNENSYVYMGIIRNDKFRTTRASKMDMNSVAVKAFVWSLENFQKGVMPESLEVWHEGRCGRCGRKLTVPESIATGFGPECAQYVAQLPVNSEAPATELDKPKVKATVVKPIQNNLFEEVATTSDLNLDNVKEL